MKKLYFGGFWWLTIPHLLVYLMYPQKEKVKQDLSQWKDGQRNSHLWPWWSVVPIPMIILLLLSSCKIEVYGIFSGHKKLCNEFPLKVVYTQKTIDSLQNDNRIYIVSIQSIKNFLSKNDSVLIQRWVPGCSSESCTSPYLFEEYCRLNNYEPMCLLCFYVGEDTFNLFHSEKMPLLFPNYWKEYNTNNQRKGNSTFQNELTGDISNHPYWLFYKGKFIRYLDKLP